MKPYAPLMRLAAAIATAGAGLGVIAMVSAPVMAVAAPVAGALARAF